MKINALLALLFIALCSTALFGQTPTMRVGFMDSVKMSDRGGLARVNAAMDLLDKEFKTRADELAEISERIKRLSAEALAASNAGNTALFNSKMDEKRRLEAEGNSKQSSAKADYDVRSNAILTPIFEDVTRAIAEFAKAKGYDIIIDLTGPAGTLLYLNTAAKTPAMDLTAAFVAEYNASPAGKAAVVDPCPIGRVTASVAQVKAGGEVSFTVALTGGDQRVSPTFAWTFENGAISSGQGTNKITATVKNPGQVCTFVDVGGYSRACRVGFASDNVTVNP